MTNVEYRAQGLETLQAVVGLSSKEKKILSPENQTEQLRREQTESIMRINEEKKNQAKRAEAIKVSEVRDAIQKDFATPNKVKDTIQKIGSAALFLKHGVINTTGELKPGVFKWTKADKSEFGFNYTDSTGKVQTKRFQTPSSGSVNMEAVFKRLNQDIVEKEKKISLDAQPKMVQNHIDNFDVTTLSKKQLTYLKDNNLISAFDNTLDLKVGAGNGISLTQTEVKLGSIGSLKIKDFYANSKIDTVKFKQELAKFLDKKADEYYLTSIKGLMSNLDKSRLAITDASMRNTINGLEKRIQNAKALGVNIPVDILNKFNAKQDQLKKLDTYTTEYQRLNNLYKTYDTIFNSTNSNLSAIQMRTKMREFIDITAKLENNSLALGNDLKRGTAKAAFDAASKTEEYNALVKKYKALAALLQ